MSNYLSCGQEFVSRAAKVVAFYIGLKKLTNSVYDHNINTTSLIILESIQSMNHGKTHRFQ